MSKFDGDMIDILIGFSAVYLTRYFFPGCFPYRLVGWIALAFCWMTINALVLAYFHHEEQRRIEKFGTDEDDDEWVDRLVDEMNKAIDTNHPSA